MLLHCYSLLRKSFGIAAFRAKPAQGDDAYISVRVIEPILLEVANSSEE
jgi:hypothetical protein